MTIHIIDISYMTIITITIKVHKSSHKVHTSSNVHTSSETFVHLTGSAAEAVAAAMDHLAPTSYTAATPEAATEATVPEAATETAAPEAATEASPEAAEATYLDRRAHHWMLLIDSTYS